MCDFNMFHVWQLLCIIFLESNGLFSLSAVEIIHLAESITKEIFAVCFNAA